MPFVALWIVAPIVSLGGMFWAWGNAAEQTGTAVDKSKEVLIPVTIVAGLAVVAVIIWEVKKR